MFSFFKPKLLFKGAYFKARVDLAGTNDFPTSIISLFEYENGTPPHYLCSMTLMGNNTSLTLHEEVYINLIEVRKRIYACNLKQDTADGTGQIYMSEYDFYQRGAINLELLNGPFTSSSHGHTHGIFSASFHNNKHRLSFNEDLGPIPDEALSDII